MWWIFYCLDDFTLDDFTLDFNLVDFTSSDSFQTARSYFYQSQRVRKELVSRIKQDLSGQLPNEKALEICWEIGDDAFTFKIMLDERHLTRRVTLSVISSIYDPLGFATPFALEGRILRSLYEQNLQWNVKACNDVKWKWKRKRKRKWKRKLKQTEQLRTQRCFKPADFGEVLSISLHHFSDVSKLGYGQCSYIMMISKEGKIYCFLLLGKARVVPKTFASILRLELTDTTLSVEVTSLLKKELDLDKVEERFWKDSKISTTCS